jgi:site-specific recombinase XerD
VTPGAVTPDQIEAYREALVENGCKPYTIKTRMAALRCFFRWCIRKRYCESDPTEQLVFARIPRALPRALKKSELRALLQAIRHPDEELNARRTFVWERNRMLIYLLLYTGLRRSEAATLRWREVDLEDETITVLDGKGGKSRVVPIHPVVLKELEAVPPERRGGKMYVFQKFDGEPFNEQAVHAVFDKWLPRLGVDGVHAHRLRHTFATTLLHSGVHIGRIQKMMGHEDIETTARYLLLEEDEDRAAIRGMPDLTEK